MHRIRAWASDLKDSADALVARVKRTLGPKARILGYSLFLLVAGGLLFLLIRNWRRIDWSSYRLDPVNLALSVLPHALTFSLGGLGWALIVREIDEGQTIGDSFRIYVLSSIGRNVPGGIWHVAGRIHLHRQAGGSGAVTVVATAVELVLAVLAGTAIYALGVLTSSVDSLIPHGVLIALLLLEGVTLWPPLFNRVVNWFVGRFSDQDVPSVALEGGTILQWVSLYILILFLGGVVLRMVGNAIYPLGWEMLPGLAGAWGISMAVSGLTFWIPVRLGIRDGMLALALSQQMPISAAVVIAALWRVWISMLEITWSALAGLTAWWRSR